MRDEYYASRRPEEELYDLDGDGLEMRNLVDDRRCGDMLKQMRDRACDWMCRTDDRVLEGDWPAMPEQAERDRRGATPS